MPGQCRVAGEIFKRETTWQEREAKLVEDKRYLSSRLNETTKSVVKNGVVQKKSFLIGRSTLKTLIKATICDRTF